MYTFAILTLKWLYQFHPIIAWAPEEVEVAIKYLLNKTVLLLNVPSLELDMSIFFRKLGENLEKASSACHFISKFEWTFYMSVLPCRIAIRIQFSWNITIKVFRWKNTFSEFSTFSTSNPT